jgi:flagella basal body P-ring formation protein FlgA
MADALRLERAPSHAARHQQSASRSTVSVDDVTLVADSETCKPRSEKKAASAPDCLSRYLERVDQRIQRAKPRRFRLPRPPLVRAWPVVREMALVASQQSRVSNSGTGSPLRFDVTVGALDPRLKLAACQRIEPYLPPGTRLWGKARIGLRCTQGERPWNVYLPITVHVYGQTLVASQPLMLGSTVQSGDLTFAEVDLAEDNSPAIINEALAIGRVLTRSLLAGQSIRQADLRARQWFAAGDTVKVMARGKGFSVSGSGTALSPGLDGQSARVRTDSGQIITGTPVAARELEINL